MAVKLNKIPTASQKKRWNRLAEMGCIVGIAGKGNCKGRRTIHHIEVGGSSPEHNARKDHDKTICLCHHHHQGKEGIDRREYGATEKVFDWEGTFGTEAYFLDETNRLLEESCYEL